MRRCLRPASALLLLALGGCAALPWPHAQRGAGEGVPRGGWLDLRGALHVHTRASHDSPGTIEALVAAARSAGLAWVALTEHTRPGRQGAHGRFDDVVVLPGFELSSAGASLHAIGVAVPPPPTKEPAALVRWIRSQGGVSVVGHFEHSRLAVPEAFATARPDAVELVNLHAVANRSRAALAWRALLLPALPALRVLLRLPEENVAHWEALPGPPPIVGGVDAHAKLRLLGPAGGTVDRYRTIFRLLTTHVLARSASPTAILDAIRAGRTYLAFEGLAGVDAFTFERVAAGFRLAAPREANLALVCDGVPTATADAREATLTPPPGARQCRAVASLDGRPWILTSYQPAPGAPEPHAQKW